MIYLDNNASTPVHPEVLEAMLPFFTTHFTNPSATSNPLGLKSFKAIEKAREELAQLLEVSPQELTFTSGATEGINWVLQQLPKVYATKGKHIVASTIEHTAVLKTLPYLEQEGRIEVSYLQPDLNGIIHPDALEAVMRPDTILVVVSLVNNELGTIQSYTSELSTLTHEYKALFFSDCTQAVGKLHFNLNALGIDIAVLSAHKFYGPKGVGAVYLRRKQPRVSLIPLMYGGEQEHGKRAGTQNVPAIVGLGKACELVQSHLTTWTQQLKNYQEWIETACLQFPEQYLINALEVDRIPNTSHLYLKTKTRKLIEQQFSKFIYSYGSACQTQNYEPSHVLTALGYTKEEALQQIRLSTSIFTTEEEIKALVEVLKMNH